ncbi:MAG: methylenetetrahydrofolate--tRNA-(uracil(54)-C(5))-methyltransferase (FADH(2)-oxidizing) TrmFO [Myxococcota bacterium]|nr:methylenetetrahydrofolate--tRNA-(uracil(54)-C(5))-methyltransferase (FADH(2)-oxidizing) TrmFO [Myxococcota bacterium]
MATQQDQAITVVGAGLAGSEAAWQAASRGARVVLYEMKPVRRSPAHISDGFAELVCSNSLRGASLGNAVGLLKEEMRRLGSLVIRAADATAVPAGRALAVDRDAFMAFITDAIVSHPNIEVRNEVVETIPEDPVTLLATGPLTAPELAAEVQQLMGDEHLYFYDAIAPTIYADSIDHDVVFRASRWEQREAPEGDGDYLNVPLSRDEYYAFVDALLEAETVPLHAFEAALYFEGCLPIEEMARRGRETLSYGPMKPVGLFDPRTGKRPYAVVQLRQEDKAGVLYNLVGFQTKLRVGGQKDIFRSLPGLGEAVFARYGSVHRNTYVKAPKCLTPTLEAVSRPGLFIAGQMAGVEGYVESAALGFIGGINAARRLLDERIVLPPESTAHGALLRHLREASPKGFQPMNVNYGLFEALEPREGDPKKLKKKVKNERFAERALDALPDWAAAVGAPA